MSSADAVALLVAVGALVAAVSSLQDALAKRGAAREDREWMKAQHRLATELFTTVSRVWAGHEAQHQAWVQQAQAHRHGDEAWAAVFREQAQQLAGHMLGWAGRTPMQWREWLATYDPVADARSRQEQAGEIVEQAHVSRDALSQSRALLDQIGAPSITRELQQAHTAANTALVRILAGDNAAHGATRRERAKDWVRRLRSVK